MYTHTEKQTSLAGTLYVRTMYISAFYSKRLDAGWKSGSIMGRHIVLEIEVTVAYPVLKKELAEITGLK